MKRTFGWAFGFVAIAASVASAQQPPPMTIHQAKNDKDAAIKDVEKALEIDPNSNQAKTRLQQLKGQ